MKFAKNLEDQAIIEWKPKYIDYVALKQLAKKIPPAPNSPFSNNQLIMQSTSIPSTPLSPAIGTYNNRLIGPTGSTGMAMIGNAIHGINDNSNSSNNATNNFHHPLHSSSSTLPSPSVPLSSPQSKTAYFTKTGKTVVTVIPPHPSTSLSTPTTPTVTFNVAANTANTATNVTNPTISIDNECKESRLESRNLECKKNQINNNQINKIEDANSKIISSGIAINKFNSTPLSLEEKTFLERVEGELAKVQEFYQQREKEAIDRKFQIMIQLQVLSQPDNHNHHGHGSHGHSHGNGSHSHNQGGHGSHHHYGSGSSASDNQSTWRSWDQRKEAAGLMNISPTASAKSLLPLPLSPSLPLSLQQQQQQQSSNIASANSLPFRSNSPPSPQDNNCMEKKIPDHLKITSLRNTSFTNLARLRIKKALKEFYRSLELLRSYRTLNVMGFQKIIKKYDKITQRNYLPLFQQRLFSSDPSSSISISVGRNSDNLDNLDNLAKSSLLPLGFPIYSSGPFTFANSSIVDSLFVDVENIYRWIFTNGNREKALNRLRSANVHPYKTFYGWANIGGFFMASSIGLIVQIAMIYNDFAIAKDYDRITLTLLYGGLYLPILMMVLFAWNMMIWKKFHINYPFIFEYDQRTMLHPQQYLSLMGGISLIYLVHVLLSILGYFDGICRMFWQPWIIIGILFLFLTIPIVIPCFPSRFYMLKVLMRIGISPFYPVRFKDFFMADQFMSLGLSFQCFAHLISFSTLDADYRMTSVKVETRWFVLIMALAPATFRILQCLRRYWDTGMWFPHIANLIKYFCSFSVQIWAYLATFEGWGFFKNVQIASLIISTIYSLFWDVVMDFGLNLECSKRIFLRKTILFKRSIYYYGIILLDLVGRLLWILPLVIHFICPGFIGGGGRHPMLLLTLLIATFESVRRIIWNFFRVEYEQINNCNSMRAIADVQLPFRIADLFYQDMASAIPINNDGNDEEVVSNQDEEDEINHEKNEKNEKNGNNNGNGNGNNNEMRQGGGNEIVIQTSIQPSFIKENVSINAPLSLNSSPSFQLGTFGIPSRQSKDNSKNEMEASLNHYQQQERQQQEQSQQQQMLETKDSVKIDLFLEEESRKSLPIQENSKSLSFKKEIIKSGWSRPSSPTDEKNPDSMV